MENVEFPNSSGFHLNLEIDGSVDSEEDTVVGDGRRRVDNDFAIKRFLNSKITMIVVINAKRVSLNS